MKYIDNEFKEGTMFRRVLLYEDNDDVIMTVEPVYEDEFEDDDGYYGDEYDGPGDGPEDDYPDDDDL
jgi:hypothetical protein